MSMPCSRARRRALGEMSGFAPEGGSEVVGTGAAARAAEVIVRPLISEDDTSVGGASPGRTIHAMVWPTGTSAPSRTLTPARMPSPGASISITALSVSTSSRVSPLATLSPSFFRQAISLPVSCAISRAGITTLIGINRDINRDRFQLEGLLGNTDLFRFRAGFNHVNDALAGGSFRLASGRQRTVHREIVGARHQELFRWEARNHLMSSRSHHNLDRKSTRLN